LEKCDYGCGKEAKFQMTSGKMCCEDFYTKCLKIRDKNKEGNKKGKLSLLFENINNLVCDYGCGKIAKYKFKNRKICCSIIDNLCSEKCRKISKSNTGKKRSEEFKKLISENRKGKPSGMKGKKQTEYCKKFNSDRLKNGEAKRLNSFDRDTEKMKIFHEKSRERMRNNGAKYMHSFPCMGYKNHTEWMSINRGKYQRSFIKKISKDEIKLRNLVRQIYKNCRFQHSVLSFDLDIAIPEYKIAIEFDGYYHFDTEEHKEYHKKRQQKIEQEGWKFYRISMFDKFPTLEKLKEDIEALIKK